MRSDDPESVRDEKSSNQPQFSDKNSNSPGKIEQTSAFKILKDIKSLGCTKDDVSAATYRIYLDLCKVRQYEEVSYHYLPALDHLYLKAKKNQDEDEEVVVPFLTTQPFTFAGMEEFQLAFSSNSIKIAICDPSSTIIYYKISKS